MTDESIFMNTAAARQYWEGEIVDGRFPLLEWLGGAGGNLVFRTQRVGRATAAIKLVPAEREDAATVLARWHEAGAITHPHLVRLFEAGECQLRGRRWLYQVMEYADENLAQVLPQRALSMREAGELLPPLLDALGAIHRQQRVHGRLKPANIVAVSNQLKLTSDSLRPLGRDRGEVPPTAYDAPENVKRGLSPASDVWSLGMTLVAVFLQRPLSWERDSNTPPEVPAAIPLPYRHIARECLRSNPDERCTVAQIREWLRPGAALRPQRLSTPERTRRVTPVTVLAIFFIALISGLVFFRHRAVQHTEHTPQAQPKPPAAIVSAPSSTPAPRVNRQGRVPGAVRERVEPNVSESARQTIQGKVRVKVELTVNSLGEVSSAELRSPGPSRYFARKALEAARQWKFQPPEVGGQPGESRWVIEFRFGQSATEAIPIEQP